MQRDEDRSPRLQVHLALAFVAILFSLNYILGKIALRDIQPLALTFLRVAGSAGCLTVISLRSSDRAWPIIGFPERGAIVLYALLGVVLNQILFLTGLSMTSAHEAAILITTIPIFTMIGAFVLGHETVSIRKIFGIAVAATGALTIIGFQGVTGSRQSLIGDLLVLMNCASYGTYLVVSKPMMVRHSATKVVTNMFVIAAVVLIPISATSLRAQHWSVVPLAAWGALAGIVIGPTVVAYLLNAWALGRTDSSMVAVYTYLQPFIATVLATATLGEKVELTTFVSGAVICTGVWLATSRRASAPPVAEE